jgi:hypothetical protein
MTVNKAEVGEGMKRIELVLVAEGGALVLTSTAANSSWSATRGPGRSIPHCFCRE